MRLPETCKLWSQDSLIKLRSEKTKIFKTKLVKEQILTIKLFLIKQLSSSVYLLLNVNQKVRDI